jgi:ubiquinone/menaquinone biosynthesis C-methylase UbiE
MKDEILTEEEQFHDEWAHGVDTDSVMVDEFFEACTSPENRQIMKWIGNIEGKEVLELGCGLGEAAVYMAKKGALVTATDLSGGMLALAEQVAQKHGVSITTVKCSADKLPFDNQRFDVVYAANLLHHVDIEITLQEAHRVLKPGGVMISWDPLAHNPAINIYRRMASGVRTDDEHPLKTADLKVWKKYFQNVRYDGKWFFTNWIFVKFYFIDKIDPNKERYWKLILKKHKELETLYNRLEKVDNVILSTIPFLKRYCWNIVIVAQK